MCNERSRSNDRDMCYHDAWLMSNEGWSMRRNAIDWWVKVGFDSVRLMYIHISAGQKVPYALC